jgi:hypothetical protein
VKEAAEIEDTTVNAWAVVTRPIAAVMPVRFLKIELRREVLSWAGSFRET